MSRGHTVDYLDTHVSWLQARCPSRRRIENVCTIALRVRAHCRRRGPARIPSCAQPGGRPQRPGPCDPPSPCAAESARRRLLRRRARPAKGRGGGSSRRATEQRHARHPKWPRNERAGRAGILGVPRSAVSRPDPQRSSWSAARRDLPVRRIPGATAQVPATGRREAVDSAALARPRSAEAHGPALRLRPRRAAFDPQLPRGAHHSAATRRVPAPGRAGDGDDRGGHRHGGRLGRDGVRLAPLPGWRCTLRARALSDRAKVRGPRRRNVPLRSARGPAGAHLRRRGHNRASRGCWPRRWDRCRQCPGTHRHRGAVRSDVLEVQWHGLRSDLERCRLPLPDHVLDRDGNEPRTVRVGLGRLRSIRGSERKHLFRGGIGR